MNKLEKMYQLEFENKYLRQQLETLAVIAESVIEKVDILLRYDERNVCIEAALANELVAIQYAMDLAKRKYKE